MSGPGKGKSKSKRPLRHRITLQEEGRKRKRLPNWAAGLVSTLKGHATIQKMTRPFTPATFCALVNSASSPER